MLEIDLERKKAGKDVQAQVTTGPKKEAEEAAAKAKAAEDERIAKLNAEEARIAKEKQAEAEKKAKEDKEEEERIAAAKKIEDENRLRATMRENALAEVSKETSAQETNDLFAAIGSMQDQPVVSVKKTFVVEINHVGAFPLIFAFWYQREGFNLSVEDFSKKTIKQMISFVEKAGNNGERIESTTISYVESIKAK